MRKGLPSQVGATFALECTKGHLVDDDEAGRSRLARKGQLGVATRVTGDNPWSVVWSNGAWGFYTDTELRGCARW